MVTIIIVNENTKDALELCLLSIKKYTEYPYKVIVIDNASTDGSLDLLKKFNWVTAIGTSCLKDGEKHGGALICLLSRICGLILSLPTANLLVLQPLCS